MASKFKRILKKTWHFIWHEDSLASWIVNIILAFVIIKFIVYPGLGLIFGTNFPVVAVVSTSMVHTPTKLCEEYQPQTTQCVKYYEDRFMLCGQNVETNKLHKIDQYWDVCGDWYKNKFITKKEFMQFPFKNGFDRGDIMVLFGVKPEKVKVGDVIVFNSNRPYPIIHRVIDMTENEGQFIFQTKGDNNADQVVDTGLDETSVTQDLVIGKAVMQIPYLGYIKIWFVDLMDLFGLGHLFK